MINWSGIDIEIMQREQEPQLELEPESQGYNDEVVEESRAQNIQMELEVDGAVGSE